MEINPLRGVYDDFISIIRDSIIKYDYEARKYETLEMTKSADQYISARLGEDNFYSYMTYDKSMLISLGITDPTTIELYMDNRRNIPEMYHDRLLEKMRMKIINEYEEPNNYYRAMAGIPDVGDTEFIYVTQSIHQIHHIPIDIPLHKLSLDDIILLNEIGYIDDVKKIYPNKKYLSFLGNNKIDVMISRRAMNFGLIKIPVGISESMRELFIIIYEQCREYFMSTIYIEEYTNIHQFYVNFIGLSIMVMTIQQIIPRSLKKNIDRDFFDDYSIQLLYETYNIPFISELDISTQKALVQNLNMLLQYKSTDKVLYDVASLLGYDRVQIFKYYLMKEQLFDDDDLPIEATKLIENEYGEEVEVPDYERMYDIYFQKIELKEKDYHKAFQSNNDKIPYMDIVEEDPYWWNDNELYNQLYEDEYNFKETKYLSMNISYRLTEVMFETVYLVKMLMDNKERLYSVSMNLPRILGTSDISIFNVIVGLCAMVCKKNNLKGEILTSETKVLHVLGFNFKQDFDIIRKHIRDNPNLDNKMLDYLESMRVYNVETINSIYMNIKHLRDYITEKLSSSSNIYEYRAYQNLYRALYITQENRELFNITTDPNDDKYAETYLEYLSFSHKDLYNFINNTSQNELSIYIDHTIAKLTEVIPTIKYLYATNDANNAIMEALLKLIRFFKSYTTDMIGLNVVYIFDTKALNMLKLIDAINHIQKEIITKDEMKISYSDVISTLRLIIHEKDMLKFDEQLRIFSNMLIFDKFNISDTISVKSIIHENDIVEMYDFMSTYKTIYISHTLMSMVDRATILSILRLSDMINMREFIEIKAYLELYDVVIAFDHISLKKLVHLQPDMVQIYETVNLLSRIYNSDTINFNDKMGISVNMMNQLQLMIFDAVDISSKIRLPDDIAHISMHELIDVIAKSGISDIFDMSDEIALSKNNHISNYLNMKDDAGYMSKIKSSSGNKYNDRFMSTGHSLISHALGMSDTMDITKSINHNVNNKLRDSIKLFYRD